MVRSVVLEINVKNSNYFLLSLRSSGILLKMNENVYSVLKSMIRVSAVEV